MKDVFSHLVARARDAAPRLRPRIAPRFASEASRGPVEEIEVERELSNSAPPDPETSFRPGRDEPSETRELFAARSPERLAENPRRAPIADMSASPRARPPAEVRAELAQPSPSRPASSDQPVERESPAVVIRRVVERVVESAERVRDPAPERPVGARPPPLRPNDAAALRAPAPVGSSLAARAIGVARGPVAPAWPGPAESVPAVVISIGRIDVRASAVAAPPTPARAVKRQVPLGLQEYLQRRQDER